MKQLLIILCFLITTTFSIFSMVKTDQESKQRSSSIPTAYRTKITYATFEKCFAINCGIASDLMLKAIKENKCSAIRFCFKMGGRLDTKKIIELATTDQFPAVYSCTNLQDWEPTTKDKVSINAFLFKNINMVLINSLVCSCSKPLSFVLKHNANPNFIFTAKNNRLMCPGYLAILRNDSEKLTLLLESGAVIEPNSEMSLLAFALLHNHTDATELLVNKNMYNAAVYFKKYSTCFTEPIFNKPLDLQPYLAFAQSFECDNRIIQILNDAIEKQGRIKSKSLKSVADRLLKQSKLA